MAIHKVTAKEDKPAKKADVLQTEARKTKAPAKAPKVSTPKADTPLLFRPFTALGRYFKGAWQELREVRWPTRRATWGLTIAVLIFTAFFMVLILALDAGYKALFEIILQ